MPKFLSICYFNTEEYHPNILRSCAYLGLQRKALHDPYHHHPSALISHPSPSWSLCSSHAFTPLCSPNLPSIVPASGPLHWAFFSA